MNGKVSRRNWPTSVGSTAKMNLTFLSAMVESQTFNPETRKKNDAGTNKLDSSEIVKL